jgi:oligosaccharyltransferase complex subunit beta
MLSPFHRRRLEPVTRQQNSTVFTTSFVVPDQHGIFNFLTEYRRPFLSILEEKNAVTVRHFAHDEWPRSYAISGAWPWITGISVTVVGWVAFVGLWLWSAPVPLKLTASGKKVQ